MGGWLITNLAQGHIEQSRLMDYSRNSNYWQILIKKDVYADPEVEKIRKKCTKLWRRGMVNNPMQQCELVVNLVAIQHL